LAQVEYWDDSAQCYYYFNTVTQEASWTKPGALIEDAGGYNTDGAATDYDTDNYEVAGGGADEWVEYWDDSANAYYYYNTRTEEARWTKPEGAGGGGGGGGDTGWDSAYDSVRKNMIHPDPVQIAESCLCTLPTGV
jgi:hypothetical protein